jgi:5-oxoprolinase (ATP-hydrolysing) subunit A
MTIARIDLNCDLGEFDTSSSQATDLALLDIVTSANIACGGHAGDASTMARTVAGAIARGVGIGAHPSYPDPANFGRIEVALSDQEIEHTVAEQIHTLDVIARAAGGRLRHVKPHGALYHAAMVRRGVAEAIARAARSCGADLILVGLAGAPGLRVWQEQGCRTAAEVFADRRYEIDGSLRSRTQPDALIANPEQAAIQAVRLVHAPAPTACGTHDGSVAPQTICIHGDTPRAPHIAAAVRRGLEAAGVQVVPLGD